MRFQLANHSVSESKGVTVLTFRLITQWFSLHKKLFKHKMYLFLNIFYNAVFYLQCLLRKLKFMFVSHCRLSFFTFLYIYSSDCQYILSDTFVCLSLSLFINNSLLWTDCPCFTMTQMLSVIDREQKRRRGLV